MPNPVRIYVLHHPGSNDARELTNRIYDWFRLPSREGIPVYVRSAPAPGKALPEQAFGMRDREPVLEYFIPLIDDRLVRDPRWHDYLNAIAAGCDASRDTSPPGYRGVLFPVALDSTAFNLPRAVTRRNFIRHGLDPKTAPVDPAMQTALATEETLKHLTEALARDLNDWLFDTPAASRSKADARFKIFLSYARADGTAIPKALRNYIQSETQCLAFLDENDIGFGQSFANVIGAHVGGAVASETAAGLAPDIERLARAMIVVNSDHYADRPWCRWEIGRFTRPQSLPLAPPAAPEAAAPRLHVFHPLLVVDAMTGPRLTRVLPELAQAPMVRWEEGRARLCFSVLMREVVLGLRDVLVARQVSVEEPPVPGTIFVNRLPGPVAIEGLLRAPLPEGSSGTASRRVLRYPGYGLSLMELRLLRETFTEVEFRAFWDLLPEDERADEAIVQLRRALADIESDDAPLPLANQVISISTAHSSLEDLAARGCLPQHQDEVLLHLLRPLVRLGADLLYGGLPPTAPASTPGQQRPSATRNITAALLRLIAEERREEEPGAPSSPAQRANAILFNVCSWPRYLLVTPRDEAAWINICRILPFNPPDAGLPPWTQPVPLDTEAPPAGYRRYLTRLIGVLRARTPAGFRFRMPGDELRLIRPDAFIFMGGKLSEFSGILPGILEEFFHAQKTGRPIYLFGGLGGAAGVLARALCDAPDAPRPPELTVAYYRRQTSSNKLHDYPTLLRELRPGDPRPGPLLDLLWSLIRRHRSGTLHTLFNNGLSHKANRELILTDNTFAAVRLAWQGLSQKLLPAKDPNPPTAGVKRRRRPIARRRA